MTSSAVAAATPLDALPADARLAMPPRTVALTLALGLAALLTFTRAVAGWDLLSILRLPDNDDMMRLAQVRDWLAGQRFNDLLQHRLGPPGGASMHWSRIADAGPAAMLLALRPLLGERAATLTMLVGWQAILLATYLWLAARNARLIAGERAMPIAVIFAALAFPTIALFTPGRIDHHALQIVLTFVTVGMLLTPPTLRSGLAGGVAAALSLAVGLEVAPELVAVMAVLGLGWIWQPAGAHRRVGGFALGLGGTTAALLIFARPDVWPTQWCDGFTPASSRATMAAAALFGALALAGPRLRTWRARLATSGVFGGVTAAYIWSGSQACFAGPYGALDPYLQHAWMANVAEARGLFWAIDHGGTALAYGGVAFAGLAACGVLLRDPTQRARWWPFAVFLAINVVALVWQVRVAYIVAALATLPFAALMIEARGDERLGRRLLLWVAGSGIAWSLLGSLASATAATPAGTADTRAGKLCMDGQGMMQLARLPTGTVIAPLDSAAYIIGMTDHRSIAAPYHRNNSGNLAMYRFFLSPTAKAEPIARAWRADYVVMCTNSLQQAEVLAERPGTLIETLQQGRPPAWLTRVGGNSGGMSIYRVQAR